MIDNERQHYAADPAMLALIQAVRAHEFHTDLMSGVFRAAPERSREEWLQRAAEIIEEHTERLRRDDIRDLLARVESGDVELVGAVDGVE
jgi:acyl-CoA reductase-like NAD-dependent aldehyde dehydrogenase